MLKVLVADENDKDVTKCCQYLSDYDQNIRPIGCNTGIDTLDKYNKVKADILILNSHFKDMKSTEIVDRLSATIEERKNSNIILTVNVKKEQLNFVNTEKIFGFFDKPLDLEKIAEAVEKIKEENTYSELTEDYLNKLLFSMKIIIGSVQTEILKEAITECYNYPYLLTNFDAVLSLLSYKYNGMDTEAIRYAIRYSLHHLNSSRESLKDHPVVKMFEPNKNISPKTFLEVVVSYIHLQKNQKIFF